MVIGNTRHLLQKGQNRRTFFNLTLHYMSLPIFYVVCALICVDGVVGITNRYELDRLDFELWWEEEIFSSLYPARSGFGGLGVACWPLVPKFAGSNPAEAVGFLRAKKSSVRLPSEGK